MIDLGPSMFEDGMAYVALSQVRTLDGVALLDLVAGIYARGTGNGTTAGCIYWSGIIKWS